MSKRTFSDTLTSVIHALEDPWDDKTGQNDKVRSAGKMDDDEPLISAFGLDLVDRGGKPTSWMHPTYNGPNEKKRREFTRKTTYRGYIRL